MLSDFGVKQYEVTRGLSERPRRPDEAAHKKRMNRREVLIAELWALWRTAGRHARFGQSRGRAGQRLGAGLRIQREQGTGVEEGTRVEG